MRPLLIALVLLTTAAAPARAAVVSGREAPPSCDRGCSTTLVVQLRADPGERNDVTVVDVRFGAIRLRDDGAPLRVEGTGCRLEAPNEAFCTYGGALSAAVSTGDEADRFRGEGVSVDLGAGDDTAFGTQLSGGEGADALELTAAGYGYAGPGDDRVTGSPAADWLNGGSGRDQLQGLAGHDVLDDGDATGAAGPDALDGGEGFDRVEYNGRTASVTVDLAGVGGEAGEGDALTSIERAIGGSGDDVLVGTPARDGLSGGPGRDRISGGDGDDRLDGEDGDDVLDGGPGADRIDGGTGADAVDGGPGDDPALAGGPDPDRVTGGEGADVLAGGGAVDVLDGGAGDDGLDIGDDYVRDEARCGDGADSAAVTRGDVADACETVRTVSLRPLLDRQTPRHRGRPALDLLGRATEVVLQCGALELYDCDGTIEVRVGGRKVGGARYACPAAPGRPCYGQENGTVVLLPRRLARRVRRHGPVRARVIVTLGGGAELGGIPVAHRVWLVRR